MFSLVDIVTALDKGKHCRELQYTQIFTLQHGYHTSHSVQREKNIVDYR